MKRHIPNTITLCNLICGCIAVKYAFGSQFYAALTFIVAGAVFDFFDGFAARKLGVTSPVGKELDSLADVITFGFAPAMMVFALLTTYIHAYYADSATGSACCLQKYINAAAFLIVAFSALRLAKFNVDDRQASSFIGLPTPANALLLSSIVITLGNHRDWLAAIGGTTIHHALTGIIILCIVIAVSCTLLVCNLPLFALKFKNFSWADNKVRYIFLSTSLALLIVGLAQSVTRLIASVSLIIAWYVLLSLLTKSKREK